MNSAVIGIAIALLSLPLGKLRDHYGSLDGVVGWSPRRRRQARQWGPGPTVSAH